MLRYAYSVVYYGADEIPFEEFYLFPWRVHNEVERRINASITHTSFWLGIEGCEPSDFEF